MNSDNYRLDDQIGFVMRRATQRHQAIFATEMPDLTPTQFAALAKLRELGAVSQNELGRQTAMDAATIKGVIDRLRKRGFVTTRPDATDLRRLFVETTDTGIKAFERYVGAARRITEQTLEPLDDRDRAELLRLLDRIAGGPEAENKKRKSR